MYKKNLYIVSILALGILSACDLGQFTQSEETPEFVISVTNDPHPLTVASDAKIYATLRKDRRGVSGCRVRFRQYMPSGGHGDKKEVWTEMQEGGSSGIYQAQSQVFSVGGEWELEFTVNCSGKDRVIVFPYYVQSSEGV